MPIPIIICRQKTSNNNVEMSANSSTMQSSEPVSTGSGTDVETAPSLLSAIKDLTFNTPLLTDQNTEPKHHHVDSLNNFESYSKGTIHEAEDEDLTNEKLHWKETNEFASAIASRAKRLHAAILRAATSPLSQSNSAELTQKVIRLETDLKGMDDKLEEIAKARNEAVASERRVRRGLYRLASGRMTLEDVLKVCIFIIVVFSCSDSTFTFLIVVFLCEGRRKRGQRSLIHGNNCND